MKITFIKSLLATAAFVAASTASAAIITVPTDGTTVVGDFALTGSSTWTFSPSLINVLNELVDPRPTNHGAGTVSSARDVDGFYTDLSMSKPMTSLDIDDDTGALLSMNTAGGITLWPPIRKAISTGGLLTVTDMHIDLINKKVYADIIGANGVGPLNDFYLWNFANITSDESPDFFHNKITGLSITTAGLDLFVRSLGLLGTAHGAMSSVSDFGTIDTVITPTVVPEPATLAYLMGGLAIVALSLRRRAK